MALPVRLKIKKCRSNASLPKKATAGSAAFDLYAALSEPLLLRPGIFRSVPTGIAIELPGPGYVALIFARSGLATKFGVGLVNSVGVIDSDYRGEIQVGLINHGQSNYTVQPGDRIAQMMITQTAAPLVKIIEADQIGNTARAGGGFGSTGR